MKSNSIIGWVAGVALTAVAVYAIAYGVGKGYTRGKAGEKLV